MHKLGLHRRGMLRVKSKHGMQWYATSMREGSFAYGARGCSARIHVAVGRVPNTRLCTRTRSARSARAETSVGISNTPVEKGIDYREVCKWVPLDVVIRTWFATALGVLLLYFCIPHFGTLASKLGQGDFRGVLFTSGILSTMISARALSQYLQDVWGWRAALVTVHKLRQKAFAALLHQSLPTFHHSSKLKEESSGGLSHLLITEAEKSALLIHALIQRFIPGIFQIVGMVFRMVSLAPMLTVATLLVAPLMGVVATKVGEIVRRSSRWDLRSSAELSSHIAQVFSMFEFATMYNAIEEERERFQVLSKSILQGRTNTEKVRAVLPVLLTMVYTLAVMVLFAASSWFIKSSMMDPKQVVSFCTTLVFLIEPIQGVAAAYNEVKQNQASLERLTRASLRSNPESEGALRSERARRGPPAPTSDWSIRFDSVSFSYSGSSPAILRDCNVHICHGQRVAIIGASGSGKSTLAKLLLRLYEVGEGTLWIGHVAIRDMDRRDVRRSICMVPQECPLIHGSILDNLLYGTSGSPVPDRAEIEQVCKMIKLHDVISGLPQGYATCIGGSSTSGLSAGQRQRLGIARGLLRRPKVLVLDEALSALDTESASEVLEGIYSTMEGNTIIHIAHRLETVGRIERLFVFTKGGTLEEQGDPAPYLRRERLAR